MHNLKWQTTANSGFYHTISEFLTLFSLGSYSDRIPLKSMGKYYLKYWMNNPCSIILLAILFILILVYVILKHKYFSKNT